MRADPEAQEAVLAAFIQVEGPLDLLADFIAAIERQGFTIVRASDDESRPDPITYIHHGVEYRLEQMTAFGPTDRQTPG